VIAKVDLQKEKRGWHHFIIICDNLDPCGEGNIKFFIDGTIRGENKCLCF